MSQEIYRQRSRVTDGVLDELGKSDESGMSGETGGMDGGDGWLIPQEWRLDVELLFGGEAEFVLALYPRWFAALTARLDAVLEDMPADLPDAAARAAGELARERPALFALLAAYRDHPALEEVRLRERRLLDWAPGAQLTGLAQALQVPGRVLAPA